MSFEERCNFPWWVAEPPTYEVFKQEDLLLQFTPSVADELPAARSNLECLRRLGF